MELDEFKIGDSCSRPKSQRRAVTRRHVWVGRLTKYLAETAGRQHNRRRQRCAHTVALTWSDHMKCHPGRSATRRRDDVKDESVLYDINSRISTDGRHECSGHFGSRCVTSGMSDPIAMVTTFTRQRDRSCRVGVEVRTPGDEFSNSIRTLGHQDVDGPFVAQPSTRFEGVSHVLGR
jgi:hypothetical protein